MVRMMVLGAVALSFSSCAFLRSWIHKEPATRSTAAAEEPTPPPVKEPEQKMRTYTGTPTAKWTDDVPNTVWSPYIDGKKVAVDGIAPGTLVADPNCPEPMKALFYVPEVGARKATSADSGND